MGLIKKNFQKLSLDEKPRILVKHFGVMVSEKHRDINDVHPVVFDEWLQPNEDDEAINPWWSDIISVNGKSIEKYSEDEWKKLVEKINDVSIVFPYSETEALKEFKDEKLTIEIEDQYGGSRTLVLPLRNFPLAPVSVELFISSVDNIDSKTGSFEASSQVFVHWRDMRLAQLAKEVFDEYDSTIGNRYSKSPLESHGFYCDYDLEKIEELGVFIPRPYSRNFLPKIESTSQKLILTYQPLQLVCGLEEFECNTMDETSGKLELSYQKNLYGVYKTEFELEKFPFDKQEIIFPFYPRENFSGSSEDFVALQYSEKNYLEQSTYELKDELQNWEITGHNFENASFYSVSMDTRLPMLKFKLEVKRDSGYYLLKILLPVLLILLISWSTFWIGPDELESRVTISIVCLLSLIAYNFVIEEDLPKLGYLTFMDAIILLAYFFSGMPTIISVTSHRLLSTNRNSLCMSLEKWVKFYVPMGFIMGCLWVSRDYDLFDIW